MICTDKKVTFVSNHDFKTVLIELLIPYSYENELKESLLCNILFKNNREYKEESAMNQALLKRNILSMHVGRTSVGKTNFYSLRLMMPDDTLLTQDEIRDNILFFLDSFYHPYLENDAFDESLVAKKKEEMLTYISNGNQNIDSIAPRHVMDLVDTDGFLKNDIFKYKEETDTITGKELYQFYLKKLAYVRPFAFVFGRESLRTISSFLEDEFKKRNLKAIELAENYTCFLDKVSLSNIEQKEVFPFKQSYLIFSYKVKDMKEEDRKVLGLLSSLFSSQSSSLLLKTLRDEEGLVYAASSYPYTRFGMLWLEAKIHRKSYEKAKTKILELVDKMKDPIFFEKILKNVKERRRMNVIKHLDNKYSLLGDAIDVNLGYDVSAEKDYEIISKISAKDISLLVQRMDLELIYLAEGDAYEKDNT